jgi:hypothetical protein
MFQVRQSHSESEGGVLIYLSAEVSNPKLVVILGCFGLASNIVGLFLFHGTSISIYRLSQVTSSVILFESASFGHGKFICLIFR